jgi:hypothetical protein
MQRHAVRTAVGGVSVGGGSQTCGAVFCAAPRIPTRHMARAHSQCLTDEVFTCGVDVCGRSPLDAVVLCRARSAGHCLTG